MNLKQLSGWREWAIISALSALIIAIVFCPGIFLGKLIYSEDGGGSDSLDLTRVNSLFQGYLPGDWQQKPATIGEISSPQRIYSPLYTNIWWNNLSNLEQMERTRPIWQHRSLLGSELSTIWGVETADDYIVHGGGVSLSHSASLQQACANLLVACHKDGDEVSEVVASLADWLRIQSISHIVSPSKFPEFWPTSMFERCQEVAIPEIPQEPIFVYTLAQPLEKLRLVPALQKTIPTGTVNLERYLGLQDVDSLYETNFHNPPEIGKVQLISATNHTVLAETDCSQDAHLVISNT